MEAGAEVLLMEESYDVRGKQQNIFRLLGFDAEALVHMIFYRIFIFASVAIGIIVLAAMAFAPQDIGMGFIESLILIVWILFTPQVYETAKAMMIILSRGMSSPYLNQSFVNFAVKDKAAYPFYRAFPYAVLMLWILGFAIMLAMWFA